MHGRADKKLKRSYYSLLLFRNYKNICLEHLQFPNTFPYLFHNYDVTNLENVHPITFQMYKNSPIKVLLKINKFFFITLSQKWFLYFI